jgi:hypothetical protein
MIKVQGRFVAPGDNFMIHPSRQIECPLRAKVVEEILARLEREQYEEKGRVRDGVRDDRACGPDCTVRGVAA